MANKSLVQIATDLERQINVIKYTLYCLTVIVWILGGFLFGLAVALRLDTGLQEWINALDIWGFYTGIYILIFVSILVMLVPFLSCLSVYQEIKQLVLSPGAEITTNNKDADVGAGQDGNLVKVLVSEASALGGDFMNQYNVGCQFLCFFLLMVGCAITMENSKTNSGVQDTIRESMRTLIRNSFDGRTSMILNMIQEEVGCCGADGPNDYLSLRKPLPNECRDTVTGNAYFHGCTDEITWFLEDKSSWLTGIAFTLGFLHMLIAALSYILILALQKEEKMAYRR